MARFDLLKRYEEDLALFVLKLFEDYFALGVSQTLHDNLLGRLRGDASRDVRHALGSYDFA